jgi:hypothetical protein
MTKKLSDLAREALLVQNACNPLGLTKSFAVATQDLADALRELGASALDAVCRHPVFRLWASKLHDLAGLGLSDPDRYRQAYRECERLAGVES